MPVREKPKLTGEAKVYLENWALKNNAETYEARRFEKVADATREASVTNILKVAKRIKKNKTS